MVDSTTDFPKHTSPSKNQLRSFPAQCAARAATARGSGVPALWCQPPFELSQKQPAFCAALHRKNQTLSERASSPRQYTYGSDQKPTGIKQHTALRIVSLLLHLTKQTPLVNIRSVLFMDRLKNPIGPFMSYVRIKL